VQKILIVEDEVVQRTALETYIKAWGYTVDAVETAAAAIAYLTRNEPDMVIIDLHLPDTPVWKF
jgi:DNA-binding response OmpR family regulator